jgi:hypothetical protein
VGGPYLPSWNRHSVVSGSPVVLNQHASRGVVVGGDPSLILVDRGPQPPCLFAVPFGLDADHLGAMPFPSVIDVSALYPADTLKCQN